jgi:hypothetical protein
MSEGLYPFRNHEEAWPIQSAEVSIRVTHLLARFARYGVGARGRWKRPFEFPILLNLSTIIPSIHLACETQLE